MHEAIITRVKVVPHPDPTVHSLAIGYVEDSVFIDDEIQEEVIRIGNNANGAFFCYYMPTKWTDGQFFVY